MLSVEIEGGEEMRERRIISSCRQSLLVGEHSAKTDTKYSCTNSYEQIYLRNYTGGTSPGSASRLVTYRGRLMPLRVGQRMQ